MIRRKNQVLKSMLYAENLQVYFYTLFDLKERKFIHIFFFYCLGVLNWTKEKKHILYLFIPSLQWRVHRVLKSSTSISQGKTPLKSFEELLCTILGYCLIYKYSDLPGNKYIVYVNHMNIWLVCVYTRKFFSVNTVCFFWYVWHSLFRPVLSFQKCSVMCIDKNFIQFWLEPSYFFALQVHEQRMFYEKCKVTITDEKMCRVCRKKIGNRFVSFVLYVDFKTIGICPSFKD